MDAIINFLNNEIKPIEKNITDLVLGKLNIDDFISLTQKKVNELLKGIITEAFESIDEIITNTTDQYAIEHAAMPKTIITPVGSITYKRNYYRDKKNKKYLYLADEVLGIGSHERMTISAIAQVLEEAIDTSYRKGGVQLSDIVSKQTVKNIVHNVEIPRENTQKSGTKKVKNLYVIADEDHISKQFNKVKGDLKVEGRYKYNTIIAKLACVYEGIEEESGATSDAKRYKLVNKKYFSGIYPGEENETFWNEIATYIYNTYDIDYLENVFLSSDGGKWIKAGTEYLPKCKFILDSFHITKYIHQAANQLRLSVDDAERELYIALKNNDKKAFKKAIDMILEHIEDGNPDIVLDCKKYILNNWEGITNKTEYRELLHGCSAEGQVSHILSARMSSRPMGWTVKGADQMAKLRAYKANGGQVIDLLQYKRKKANKMLAKSKEIAMEVKKRYKENKYYEIIKASIPGLESSKMEMMRRIIDSVIA